MKHDAERCTFLCGMPSDAAVAIAFLERNPPSSFAIEWNRSQPPSASRDQRIFAYLEWMAVLSTSHSQLSRLGFEVIPNATAAQLLSEISGRSTATAIIAHHELGEGLEMLDRVVSYDEVARAAPTTPSIIHLGVCRSNNLAPIFKGNCSDVRVISSKLEVDPLFFARTLVETVAYWRSKPQDYVEAFFKVRMALFDALA